MDGRKKMLEQIKAVVQQLKALEEVFTDILNTLTIEAAKGGDVQPDKTSDEPPSPGGGEPPEPPHH